MATTHNATSGDVVIVNSEDVVKAPWTILFPASPLNNYRVTVCNTTDVTPQTPITHDFNGRNYFHVKLSPTSGTSIDIVMPAQSWEWVFNEQGNFWYPLDDGGLFNGFGPSAP